MSPPISSRISGRAHHTPGPLAYPLLTQTIVKMLMASDLSLRGRFAPVAISGRQCRFVPAAVKMARAATDAIGLYVLSFSVRTDSAFPRLPRRLRLLAMTNPGASAFHSRFLYTTSPMRHTREALMKAARADGERFFTETRLEKRGNTLCTRKGHAASVRRQSRQRLRNISSFSSRWIGEKDPAAAADDFVRASQKKHAEGCT